MAKTTQISTQATEAEISALKAATEKESIKDALEDAMQYRIRHPVSED